MKTFIRPSVLIVIFVLCMLPFAFPNAYIVDVAIRICLAGIVAIGLNLLMGFAGQVSIGHAAFVALGAYASGVATIRYGWSPLFALAVGAVGVAVSNRGGVRC